MADEKDKDETSEEQKQAHFEGEGKATVENVETGERSSVDFEGGATVTSLPDRENCVYCGTVEPNAHWNADCPKAQAQASRGATRPTAKATAAAAGPAAVTRSGRVD